MHRIKNVLLILLTFILVATGALLPRGTALLQDRQLEKTDDRRKLDQAQLLIQQEMSTAQLLNLLKNEYTILTWDSNTSLSEEEAMDHAFQTALLMVKYGILSFTTVDQSEQNVSVTPHLIISNTENLAAVLWKCTWGSATGDTCTMWIDDSTGLMCGMTAAEAAVSVSDAGDYPESIIYYGAAATSIDYLTAGWIRFIDDAYGLLTRDIMKTYPDDGQEAFTLTFELASEDAPQNTCTVNLTYSGDTISFIL